MSPSSPSGAPRISVIIPTRNRVERLRKVLDAALADAYSNKEIIVCDGASMDGTVQLLQSYGDGIRWVSERDGGEFPARNKAVAMATGSIIRNLSDDDIPVAGALAIAADFFARHPDTDILFGQSVNFYVTRDGRVVKSDARPRTEKSITIRNFIQGHALFPVSETVFLRRSVFERIGGFESVRGGDYEYWARAAHRGLKLRISDQVFVHHYRYEEGESGMASIYRDLLSAHLMLAQRYGSAWDRFYMVALRLPYLRAKFDILRRLPSGVARRLREALWSRRKSLSVT
jgi:glycosyltransferase involved in cell wall biosynthesis